MKSVVGRRSFHRALRQEKFCGISKGLGTSVGKRGGLWKAGKQENRAA